MNFEKNLELKKIFNQEIKNSSVNDIISYFKSNKCNSNILKGISKKNYLSRGVYGSIYKIYIKDYIFVIKIFPYKINYNLNEFVIYTELYNLFEKHKFYHIPILFDLFICKNKLKFNKIINFLIKEKSIEESEYYCLLFNEYCENGTLQHYMTNNNSENDYKLFLLQFFIILYFLKIHFKDFLHNDLHTNNFLIRKINKKKFNYNINNFKFKYECDFELLINDFGMSTTKKYNKNLFPKSFKKDIRYDIFKFINTFYNNITKNYNSITNFIVNICHPNVLKKRITYEDIEIVRTFSLNISIEELNKIYPFINIPTIENILKNELFKNYVSSNF